ncbi:MAG: HAD family hydrolase [Anaerolineaceae bacterium]|jgi:phosphoglycolate phosphatase-like HAD superfamily hydrolase
MADLRSVHHVLFDFDGTLSVLRQGWEPVMETVMLEAICGGKTPSEQLIAEVRNYIDLSTGKLTISQMQWLADKVRTFGMEKHPLSAAAYKKRYLQTLMVSVSVRLEALETGKASAGDYLILGSQEFIRGLAEKGVELYIASGSDHIDVVRETNALGISNYFQGGIYGALDVSELNGKERVIQHILDDHHLAGNELLVVGDGPVEIIEGRQRGSITLGVASDEVVRSGWNEHKIERLTRAGADLLVADFAHSSELIKILVS